MFSSVQSRSADRHDEQGRKDHGFTLVELLIVIVILGILATITVFAVTGITSKANVSKCQADKSSLVTAIEAYNAGEGSYPTTLAALSTATTGGVVYMKTALSPAALALYTYTPSSGTLVAVSPSTC